MEKKIVITDTYMSSLQKLNNQERKQATNTIKDMRQDISLPALSVHQVDREKCDSKFRSARVNSDLRVIFMLDGDYCTLLYIDHHDDAYDWCKGKFFRNTDFGATYIFDVIKEEEKITKLVEAEDNNLVSIPLLKDKITAKELKKIGFNDIHANNLLKIDNEDMLMEYISIFPEELQEGIVDIYTESRSFDEVYNSLIAVDTTDQAIQPENSLLQKDSRRRFYVTQSMDELEYLMENENFEKWTTFLHPSQEKLVKIHANGPVLVEGGPGTGKTVLGMHRAAYLSQNVFKASNGKKILFCTFSKKLAKNISKNLEKLYLQKGIKNNVDVMGVDAFIFQQLELVKKNLYNVDQKAFESLFRRVYNTQKRQYSLEFYFYEYYQIVERFGILTLSQYLTADRRGMGTPLNENQRKYVWSFFADLYKQQNKENISTFINRAEKLEQLLDAGEVQPMYDAIIIDEAQDLQPTKLRLLNKCLINKKDGLMILSDYNQRIYNLLTWRGDANINIVGRTYYLNVNYRTTKEISDYASMLYFKGGNKNDYMKSYKSIVTGASPIVQGFKDTECQWEAIVATINDLEAQGVPANEVCIVLPMQTEMDSLQRILDKYGRDYLILKEDVIPSEATTNQVCLCLTQGVKGLEFMYVIMASSEKVGSVTAGKYEADQAAIENYQKRIDCERYVAATRARDGLMVTYVEEN